MAQIVWWLVREKTRGLLKVSPGGSRILLFLERRSRLSFLLCPSFNLTSSGDKETNQLRMEASVMDLDQEEVSFPDFA